MVDSWNFPRMVTSRGGQHGKETDADRVMSSGGIRGSGRWRSRYHPTSSLTRDFEFENNVTSTRDSTAGNRKHTMGKNQDAPASGSLLLATNKHRNDSAYIRVSSPTWLQNETLAATTRFDNFELRIGNTSMAISVHLLQGPTVGWSRQLYLMIISEELAWATVYYYHRTPPMRMVCVVIFERLHNKTRRRKTFQVRQAPTPNTRGVEIVGIDPNNRFAMNRKLR